MYICGSVHTYVVYVYCIPCTNENKEPICNHMVPKTLVEMQQESRKLLESGLIKNDFGVFIIIVAGLLPLTCF